MPGFVKTSADEKKWSAAKSAAGKEGGETNWDLANYIFHRSGKDKMKDQAEHDAKCRIRKGR